MCVALLMCYVCACVVACKMSILWFRYLMKVTRFAAINFGGGIQQMDVLQRTPPLTFLVPPALFLFQIVACRLVRKVRQHFIKQRLGRSSWLVSVISFDFVKLWLACRRTSYLKQLHANNTYRYKHHHVRNSLGHAYSNSYFFGNRRGRVPRFPGQH